MCIFLDDPEGTVRRLVTTQYRVPADKLLRCGEHSDTEVAFTGWAVSEIVVNFIASADKAEVM